MTTARRVLRGGRVDRPLLDRHVSRQPALGRRGEQHSFLEGFKKKQAGPTANPVRRSGKRPTIPRGTVAAGRLRSLHRGCSFVVVNDSGDRERSVRLSFPPGGPSHQRGDRSETGSRSALRAAGRSTGNRQRRPKYRHCYPTRHVRPSRRQPSKPQKKSRGGSTAQARASGRIERKPDKGQLRGSPSPCLKITAFQSLLGPWRKHRTRWSSQRLTAHVDAPARRDRHP